MDLILDSENSLTLTQHAIDYEDYTALFQRMGLSLSLTECHGGLTGLLCATDTINSDKWTRDVLTESSVGPAPADDLSAIRRIYEATINELEDADYSFRLLLPPDESPLHTRAEALSLWCQGFLWGLGLGGIQDTAKLPGDVNEVMQDMAEISRLNFAATGNNDDETAYSEIVEYVRMAALLIYEELRLLRSARPDGNAVH